MALTLEQAHKQQDQYQPNLEVKEQLGGISLMAFIGATSSGKNYFMDASGYHIVGTLTSRPPREGDNTGYQYFTNEQLLSKIERGELVQYAVNLRNQTIYASDESCYEKDRTNVADIFSFVIYHLTTLGFARVLPIGILRPVEQWREAMFARFDPQSDEFLVNRLNEAKDCLHWLQNPDAPTQLIVNDRAKTAANLDVLHAYAKSGTITANAELERQTIETMLAEIERLKTAT